MKNCFFFFDRCFNAIYAIEGRCPHLQTWRDDELQHGGEKLVEIALLPGKMQHHQHPKDLKYTR